MTVTGHGERTFSAEFKSGLRATLTVSMAGINCTWTPDIPRRVLKSYKKRQRHLEAYRAWRDCCLSQYAAELGFAIKTIEVGGFDAIAIYDPTGKPDA